MLELETERLNFRQWRLSDFEPVANFYSNPEGAQFVGGQKSSEESWRLIASYIGHYELRGYSYVAIEEKATKKLVGTVGLWNSEPWPEMELGYWLLPEMHGKGFGQEAGNAVVEFAFNGLKVDTFVSYIDEKNLASIKLAERLGAIPDGGLELLTYGYHLIYRYLPTQNQA